MTRHIIYNHKVVRLLRCVLVIKLEESEFPMHTYVLDRDHTRKNNGYTYVVVS